MPDEILRALVLVACCLTLLVLERARPRRKTRLSWRRWVTNFGMIAISALTLRLALPLAAVTTAGFASHHQWGLLSQFQLPAFLEIAIAVIALDMMIYWQHVATHRIPILWRLHKVHHSDREFDVSTGLRFHPIEIVLSMIYKMLCVLALGASLTSVVIFELLLTLGALFSHTNVNLSPRLDRILRRFIVTPDMHRVHHSVINRETNSNYGFCLTIWDHLFRTYRAQPKHGHLEMTIGLAEYQDNQPAKLAWSLLLPFKNADR